MTEADVVGNNDGSGSGVLGVANLIGKCAAAAINHENVGRGPGEHFTIVVIPFAFRKPGAGVDVRVAEVGIGPVKGLLDGCSVRGDAK